MATRRDWAELHQELLHLIAKKVGNLSNFIRFRSVCKQWRAAADPADHPPQLPWILQPAALGRTNSDTETNNNLYSISSQSTSKIELPVNHREYGYYHTKEPSGGFILAHDIDEDRINHPYLYNPLTETKIILPFTKSASNSFVCMGPVNKSNSSTVKSGGLIFVFSYTFLSNDQTEIGSWRSDTNEYFTFKVPVRTILAVYYKEKIFVCEFVRRQTSVFDMTTGAKVNAVIPHPAECPRLNFFVEAMGDLLAIYNHGDDLGWFDPQFKVYRLEHTDDFGQCRWIKLNGIGERILLLGRPGGFHLSASDFEGLKGNCIYYMQYCEERNNDDVLYGSRVIRYDMANGKSDELLNFVAGSSTWFLPFLSWP